MQCAIATLPSRAGDGRGDLAVRQVAAALQLSQGGRHLLHSGDGGGGLGTSSAASGSHLIRTHYNYSLGVVDDAAVCVTNDLVRYVEHSSSAIGLLFTARTALGNLYIADKNAF